MNRHDYHIIFYTVLLSFLSLSTMPTTTSKVEAETKVDSDIGAELQEPHEDAGNAYGSKQETARNDIPSTIISTRDSISRRADDEQNAYEAQSDYVIMTDNPNGADVDVDPSHGLLTPTEDERRSSTTSTTTTKPAQRNETGQLTPLQLYQKMFLVKRKEQRFAIQPLTGMTNYATQYKMIQTVLNKMFEVMSKVQVILQEAGFIAGDDFPSDSALREAVAHILENMAMFGDLLLRFPDMVHKMYAARKDWQLLSRWSLGFCNDSNFYPEQAKKEAKKQKKQQKRKGPRMSKSRHSEL
ncbi:PREDICTED: coiled-coil domain-containing protein 134-like isoform X2 [Priapulus caudatus]|uniref:Coiled-coil domain-containing protein 134-like isoform X2 n=1 Tax=Priapulus caudatus TaxID=37621 RepID=A0ABM1EIP3_PRICU|nr:PREDICTED: coiled-coil domain-containing protein 134-like isoform X2 [Priapulus caudatus]